MKKVLISTFLLSLLIFSCDKNEEISDNRQISAAIDSEILVPSSAKLVKESSIRLSYLDGKEEYEDFAKEIAKLLSEKDFRKILKEEANKKFDGDYDILFSNFKNAAYKSKKIGDFLTSSNVSKTNEKLNISIPILIENWNESKQEPLVALTIGVVEKETKFLKAFDSKGNSYILDANVEPNVPVIIIGNNERMNYKEEIKKNKSARTSGNYEKITWLKCPNLSEIESWYFGGPELRFDGVVYNNDFSAAFQAFSNMEYPPARHNASNGYTLASWTATQYLFTWHFDNNHGPDYYIQSWEIDDSGTTHSLTVGVTAGKKDEVSGSASYTLSYKQEDKKLKGELIHYTNSSPATIADGSIEFILSN